VTGINAKFANNFLTALVLLKNIEPESMGQTDDARRPKKWCKAAWSCVPMAFGSVVK
jgi:hypothetical protein